MRVSFQKYRPSSLVLPVRGKTPWFRHFKEKIGGLTLSCVTVSPGKACHRWMVWPEIHV